MLDYVSCALFSLAGFLLRALPACAALFFGRRLGDAMLILDARRRRVVYANVRSAFAPRFSPCQAAAVTRSFYRSLGQSLVEILLIPRIDKEYIRRFITIQGREHAEAAFKRGKGVIFLGVHEGSWELYNIVAANIGYPVNLLVADQGTSRVARLLNGYRTAKGCKLIFRRNQTRELLRVLRANEAVGMSLDQGGKTGVPVPFFGKEAAMATGAVRLALRYGAAIVPVFIRRVKGPRAVISLLPPHEPVWTGDDEADVRDNVARLTRVFEDLIAGSPQEYFWRYKIWKYGRQRTMLIISDGKTGHLRQSQAVARQALRVLSEKGMTAAIETVEVRFRSRLRRLALGVCFFFAGRWVCRGCGACLKVCVTPETFAALNKARPDVVISSGSSLAPAAYWLANEFGARSVVAMKPPPGSMGKFDLVVMPRHDKPPRSRRNVCVVEGALNLIDPEYLREQSSALAAASGAEKLSPGRLYLGVLIGGDSKHFRLDASALRETIAGVKSAAAAAGAQVLLTTSRRTGVEAQRVIREALDNDPLCALLIIANERNVPEAVGGILGLSSVVVTSPESISMISEAASSGKHTIVFDSPGIRGRHRAFLDHAAAQGYVSVVKPRELCARAAELLGSPPAARVLDDAAAVRGALRRLL